MREAAQGNTRDMEDDEDERQIGQELMNLLEGTLTLLDLRLPRSRSLSAQALATTTVLRCCVLPPNQGARGPAIFGPGENDHAGERRRSQ